MVDQKYAMPLMIPGLFWSITQHILAVLAPSLFPPPLTPNLASFDGERIAIVTGSNTGIGYETARGLVGRGYTVVIACRDEVKGREAESRINGEGNNLNGGGQVGKAVYFHPLDLSSFNSVRLFAENFAGVYKKCHVLVNNAGINTTGISSDGYDLCYQANFLGHFLLTQLLIPTLINTYEAEGRKSHSRIVNLSSVMHHFSPPFITTDDWFIPAVAGCKLNTYSPSKLAPVLLSMEINRRYKEAGIFSVSVNPGGVNSDIWRNAPLPNWITKMFLTTEQGASTSIAACVEQLNHDTIYLQPYRLPSYLKTKGVSGNVAGGTHLPVYKRPFPVFEFVGFYVGFNACGARVPEKDGDNGLASALGMWEASDIIVNKKNMV